MFSRVNSLRKKSGSRVRWKCLKLSQNEGNMRLPWSLNMLDCQEAHFYILFLPFYLHCVINVLGHLNHTLVTQGLTKSCLMYFA